MFFDARSPEHPSRRRAAVFARLLSCVAVALFAGWLTSAAALAATLPEVSGLSASGTTQQAPQAPLAGGEGSVLSPAAGAVGVGQPAPGPAPAEGPGQSGGTPAGGGTAGSGPGGGPSSPVPVSASEGNTPASPSSGLAHVVEAVTTPSSTTPAGGASHEGGSGSPTTSGGVAGIEAQSPSHQGTGVVQQPPSKGSGSSSGGGAEGGPEGGAGASAVDSPPPPTGGSPTSTGGARPSALNGAPAGVPVQIVGDTIAASPFAPEQLALAPGFAGGTPLGPGGTLARLVVARVPASGSLTLSCLTRSQTVRCALLLARPDPARLGLAYAGSSSVPPSAHAIAPIADGDRFTPPPTGGVGVPGSGDLMSGSSSAASGASAASAAAMLLLAATLLLGSPLILRRLLDVCERWLVSPLDLVLERPD